MKQVETIIVRINEWLWGPPMMISLVGFGILATFYIGFPQFRKLGLGFKLTWKQIVQREEDGEGSMTSFQALSTAVAAQVGTGNIGGVASAIAAGGAGAVFWMWVTAIFGMATIYVEAILAQKYRERKEGELVGGPAYYLSRGLSNKGFAKLGKCLANIFAVLIIVALGFVGNAVQANSISGVMYEAFGINSLLLGIMIAALAALIFIGGVNRIARFTEMIVPFMALVYIIAAIAVLIMFRDMIVPVLQAIFVNAFSSRAVFGGAVGYSFQQAIRYGVARGLFSNEAGMGSTPNSHAVANVKHPVEQGAAAMVGVFIDTLIVCTATALIVLVTGSNNSGYVGPAITMEGFRIAFGNFGAKFIAVALLFFAFTTIMAWYYFGENNVKYLFKQRAALKVYQVMVMTSIIVGATSNVSLVWEFADMFNGLMVIPNIIGLVFMINEVKGLTKDFDQQNLSNEPLYFDYLYR